MFKVCLGGKQVEQLGVLGTSKTDVTMHAQ